MSHRLREPFGKAALIVAVVALVSALVGGAYAASDNGGSDKASGSTEATASAKAKRGPRGPKGAKGAKGDPGAPGAPGAAGAKGDAGPQGAKGDKGDTGSTGANGQSVSAAPIAAGGVCGPGVTGVKYTVGASSTNICNGKAGADGAAGPAGPQGEPWTAGGTLPPEETLTGTWSTGLPPAEEAEMLQPFPFAIPLAPGASYEINWFASIASGGTAKFGSAANCPGNVVEPSANPGQLCIYTLTEEGVLSVTPQGAIGAGAFVNVELDAGGKAAGTWAVTAPAAP